MMITLAPCNAQSVKSRFMLDLSGLTAEDIRTTITDWTAEKSIDAWVIVESDDAFRPVLDSTDPEVWATWQEAFEEHGDAILKFWDNVVGFNYCKDVAKVLEGFEDAYQGEFGDKEDWARDYIDSCYTLEGPLKDYFDYEKYARDCELGGDMTFIDTGNGSVYAFDSNFFIVQ